MKFSNYLIEKIDNISVGDVFIIKGQVYPMYEIDNVKGEFIEYTQHTVSGSKQHKIKIIMFKKIKGLTKK